MLYLEDGEDVRQITTDELAKLMGIDEKTIKKLKVNPVFEINPVKTKPDKLNGGVIAPAGRASKPYFFIDEGGLKKIIRYATAVIPDRVNPRLSTYEPKRVYFYDQMDVVPDYDLALFKYLLPVCKNSPIHISDWHYSFQDKESKAIETNEKATLISRCLGLITNAEVDGGLTDGELLIVAKGIYATNRNERLITNPSAKNKTIAEIKADLIELALKDPQLFLTSADSDVTEFYGMVLDSVDRGIFEVRISNNIKAWYWNSGPKKDELIVDITGTQNDFDVLKAAVESDPNRYYQAVNQAIKQASGKENIEQFLAKEKARAKEDAIIIKSDERKIQADDEPTEDELEALAAAASKTQSKPPAEFVLPANFQDSVTLLMSFNEGKRSSPKSTGIFWRAIKEKKVTVENIKEIAEKAIAETE